MREGEGAVAEPSTWSRVRVLCASLETLQE